MNNNKKNKRIWINKNKAMEKKHTQPVNTHANLTTKDRGWGKRRRKRDYPLHFITQSFIRLSLSLTPCRRRRRPDSPFIIKSSSSPFITQFFYYHTAFLRSTLYFHWICKVYSWYQYPLFSLNMQYQYCIRFRASNIASRSVSNRI